MAKVDTARPPTASADLRESFVDGSAMRREDAAL
jgi:hypothetical protein